MSLNAFQALLFIIRYELTKKLMSSRVHAIDVVQVEDLSKRNSTAESHPRANKVLFRYLNAFQALLFIIRYELTKKHFVRAWMTLGRAVTLALTYPVSIAFFGDPVR
jgi:hypothetical protein